MKRNKLTLAISQIIGISLLGIHNVNAGGFTVTSSTDTHSNGLLTFREAVDLSNMSSGLILFDDNVFSTPQTITLTNGEINITANVTIEGPGVDKLTIDGNDSSRILTISDEDPNVLDVEISGIKFQNGNGTSTLEDGHGGCILSNENLNLTDSIVTDCQASDDGGGIWNSPARLTLNNSTLSNNTAGLKGGAAYSQDQLAYLTNTTISGNTAGNLGGGLYFRDGSVMKSSTVTNNTSVDNSSAGIYSNGTSLILLNSIIAGNNGNNDLENTGFFVLLNNSVLGVAGSNAVIGDTNSSVGIDPELGPLQDNGGFFPTHSISLTSPALNRGDTNCLGVTVDQRAELRDDFACDSGAFELDGFSSILVDTVAFNTAADGFCSLPEAVFNANSDTNSFSDCAAGDGADSIGFSPDLNGQTITATNSMTLSSQITFDGPGADQLSLSGGNTTRLFDTTYSAVITINGLSLINGSTNNSGGGGAIKNRGHFTINNSILNENKAEYGGVISNFGSLILNRVTIANNESLTHGGAIHHSASASLLQIDKCNFINNVSGLGSSFGNGGAINIEGPSTNINQSTFYENSGVFSGGAIYQRDFTNTITNSTFTRNFSGTNGGAIAVYLGYFGAVTNIKNTTFSGNTTISGDGASIFTPATLNISNSILAGNGSTNECIATIISSNNNNLVEDGSCSSNAVNQLTGDPMLNPLADVGNLTFAHIPMAGSPVIDNGSMVDCAAVDQRDAERPIDGDGNGSIVCDIGSVEVDNPDIIFKNDFED